MGTALGISESQTDIAQKAAAYAMPAAAVDGMDVLAVEKAAKKAVNHARNDQGPYFLECRTYRFRAHSMFDPELYRTKSEVEKWKKRCPIQNLITQLTTEGILTDDDLKSLEHEVALEIKEAVDFAENGTWEPVQNLTRFVYSQGDTP